MQAASLDWNCLAVKDGNQMEGILLTDKTASTIYYPHVASDDYWWTGIVAYNPSAFGVHDNHHALQCRRDPSHPLNPFPSRGRENISAQLQDSAFPPRRRGSG